MSENFLELLNTLGAEEFIGLLVIAQFFINYYLYLRRIYKILRLRFHCGNNSTSRIVRHLNTLQACLPIPTPARR